jgi:hypothetical protein
VPQQQNLRINPNKGFVDPTVARLIGEKKDSVNRHHWAMATAAIMVCNWSMAQVHECVDPRYQKFAALCHQHLRGHGFHDRDLKNMFAVLRQTSRMNESAARRYINQLIIDASTNG